jgi:hypothetical protein
MSRQAATPAATTVGSMNNQRSQAIDGGESQTESDQISFGPARAAGYRVPAIGRFAAQGGPAMGSVEIT